MTVSGCRLQEEYPHWFEKPVLEMVHHNTVSLDKLVEMAWVEILTKYAVGEECDFLVSAASDVLLCNQAFGAIHVIFHPNFVAHGDCEHRHGVVWFPLSS